MVITVIKGVFLIYVAQFLRKLTKKFETGTVKKRERMSNSTVFERIWFHPR